MISKTVRQALQGTAVAAVIACIAAPAVMASHVVPVPPATAPVCTAFVSVSTNFLVDRLPQVFSNGRNYVSIPRVSPILGTPDLLTSNGYHRLCTGAGLPATAYDPAHTSPSDPLCFTPDIDGDGRCDTLEIKQYDAHNGANPAYLCHQLGSSAPFDEGAGVEINPQLSGKDLTAPFDGTTYDTVHAVTGVECNQGYAVYEQGGGKGTQLLPAQVIQACEKRDCLCHALDLPNGTQIQTILSDIDPNTNDVEDYNCGTLDSAQSTLWDLAGSAIRIRPPGTGITGAAPGFGVNCVGGNPCPDTPVAATYPSLPLVPTGGTFPTPPFPLIYP